MPNYAISDFTAAMPSVVQDQAQRLGGDLSGFVVQTILQRYSKDAPLVVVSDMPGNGTNLLALPTAPEGVSAVFDPSFSLLRSLEYPIGQTSPQYVLDSDFRIYQAPDGFKVLLNSAPAPTESIRATWTAQHAADGCTVMRKDFHAVVDYASSLALESLAAIYVQTGDAAIAADTVNYRSKAQEYLAMAKTVRKRYFAYMGIDESQTSGLDVQPSLAIGDQSLTQNSGVDRLVHGKYTR